MELPECPVCLQNYDGAAAIPRVLGCGHTACQACLARLPERFPLTIRCPACTQLVKLPPQGPSSLPKNIDLLSLSSSVPPNPNSSRDRSKVSADRSCGFFPRSWSDEFYHSWIGWILPGDGISMENSGGFCAVSRAEFRSGSESLPSQVSLVRVACLPGSSETIFEFSYVYTVLNCLHEMREEARSELALFVKGSAKKRRKIERVYGVWANLDDGFLYLVSEGINAGVWGKLRDLRDDFRAFITIGVELIEAMLSLHSEGFIAGFVGLSCFGFDEFGHAYVYLSDVLVTGRKIRKSIADAVAGRSQINHEVVEAAIRNLLKDGVFVSPELLQDILWKEGTRSEHKLTHLTGNRSDSWALACLLLRILVGKDSITEFPIMNAENISEYSKIYSSWIEKVSFLFDNQLGSGYSLIKDILLKCLVYDSESRLLVSELRRSMRELIIKPEFDLATLESAEDRDSNSCNIILGELCQFFEKFSEKRSKDDLQGREAVDEGDLSLVQMEIGEKSFVDGLSEGIFRFKDLQGHRDCITGITVGGGFAFSSSYDKTIRVWSLQDFSHVCTLEGHEHKVMAVIYADQKQPLCISGDSGGGIFVWRVGMPFGKGPLKKWFEQKDWRYSGIHALCFSKEGYIYTGCGDKSIKAWLLEDGVLSCTMNGHKSVVSTIAICDEVLYSGSWDGTIRLWSLSDHTPLTVLGEDTIGTLNSVLSLAVDRHTLIAAYENGNIKVWRNEVFMKSMKLHEGAVFATAMEGKLLFTGSWDKTVNVQELSGNELAVDPVPLGSLRCSSAITALLFWQGKLFVGYGDGLVKVCY